MKTIRRLFCKLFSMHETEVFMAYGYTEHVQCKHCGLKATVHTYDQEVVFR